MPCRCPIPYYRIKTPQNPGLGRAESSAIPSAPHRASLQPEHLTQHPAAAPYPAPGPSRQQPGSSTSLQRAACARARPRLHLAGGKKTRHSPWGLLVPPALLQTRWGQWGEAAGWWWCHLGTSPSSSAQFPGVTRKLCSSISLGISALQHSSQCLCFSTEMDSQLPGSQAGSISASGTVFIWHSIYLAQHSHMQQLGSSPVHVPAHPQLALAACFSPQGRQRDHKRCLCR